VLSAAPMLATSQPRYLTATSLAETRQMQLPVFLTFRVWICWFREVALRRAMPAITCELSQSAERRDRSKV